MAEEFITDIINETDGDAGNTSKDAMTQGLESQVTKETSPEQTDELSASKEVSNVNDKATDSSAQIEALAEKLGWNKDYQGAEKVDASTYILKSREIQDTMKTYNKDLRNQVSSLQESIKSLQEHNEKVYKTEVKKLESDLTRLKKEKLEAVELADVVKVTELDEQIEALKNDLSKPKEIKQAVNSNPVYDAWIEDNKWYEQDDEMANYADAVAQNYVGAPLERVYTLVRQKVQEVFPDKFEASKDVKNNQAVKNPVGPNSPVEKGGTRENKANFTVNDLTEAQRNIMNQFAKIGVMTEKQYIADVAKMQEG